MNVNQKQMHTHTDQYKIVESPITKNKLVVNLSADKFLIAPDFTQQRLRTAFEAFAANYIHQAPATPALRPYLFDFEHVTDAVQFRSQVERLVAHGKLIPGNTNSGRIFDLLAALWWNELIALPAEHATKYLGRISGSRLFYGDLSDRSVKRILDDLVSAGDFAGATALQHIRQVVTLLLSVCGAKQVGDLVPDSVNGRLTDAKLGKSTAQVILRVVEKHHPAVTNLIHYHDYGPFGRHDIKGDTRFLWLVQERPDLEEWRKAAEAWISHLRRNLSQSMAALTSFFELLMDSSGIPLQIESLLRDPTLLPLNEIGVRSTGPIRNFFDWVIAKYFTVEDETGRPSIIEGIANPVTSTGGVSKLYESIYDAMPTRFIRRLRELIEENDFEFPKRAFSRRADYLRRFNDMTGQWEDIWCPVRAFLILIKLEIPQRTYQIRVSNSGESDPERYDSFADTWIPNDHPLASTGEHKRPMGFITKIYDRHKNEYAPGMYFNTNKTADIFRSVEDRGHVVPWKHERVLRLGDLMRLWQEKYNPIGKLTKWSEIAERAINLRLASSLREEMGAEAFLFRDPLGQRPDHPISRTRLVTFWNGLCCELERRLEAEGELGPDGKPFKLVLRDTNGRVSGATFPLHALRTTIITALAEIGVPSEILMKVAGHALFIMSIYYQKRSAGHITEVLNEATKKIMEAEQANWVRFLKDISADDLHQYVAFNDTVALKAFGSGHRSSQIRMPFGICPVGCKRCSEGGPPLDSTRREFAPVPGPRQNCVRCRFFITGVPFLHRLLERFDLVQFEFKEMSRLYSEAELKFEKAEFERKQSVALGVPYPELHRLEMLSAVLDQRTQEVDEIAMTWHALYNRIQDCFKIRKIHNDSSKFALIASDSLSEIDFVFEVDENASREVEWLDRICQQAAFYETSDATVPNLRRMRRFDAFIKRQGHQPVFWEMSEADALHVGNEFGRFMFTTYGTEKANDLLNGRLTLKALGIEEEDRVFKKLDHLSSKPLASRRVDLVEH